MTTPVPAGPDTTPPPGRWLRFVGQADVIVGEVGRWAVDEARHVEGWLAERLLKRHDFVVTDPPAPEPSAASDPVPNAAALLDTIDVILPTDSAVPAETAEEPEAAETTAKPARRPRTTN